MQLIVHGLRMKPLNPNTTNSTVQVGKPEIGNLVTSYSIQNIGRNSVMRIAGAEGNPYVELRPGDLPFTVGVEWPGILRHTLTVTFVEENQQQWTAAGTRPAVNPASTDPIDPEAVIYSGVLVENFVNPTEKCHI